jgi:hypothetical protein
MNDEQSNQDKHVVVATKLSRPAAERLAKIAKHKGMTIYELIQMVCDTLIRYMDDRHNLSEEMERAMSIFEHMVGWADALNLADPTVQKEIAQAVYIFQDTNGEKKGFRAVMVDKPFMGQWTEDQNVMHIFERIFNICMPDLYMKLFRARILLGCNNVSEVINLLADAQVIMHLNDEYRKDFEDADRAENGHAVQYGQKTKGLQHRTPDSLAMDQRLKFDDYDREVAEYETEGWEGEHKQDEEPPEGIRPFDVEY